MTQDAILAENAELLRLFKASLAELGEDVAKQRVNDVGFFLNEYLLDEAGPFREGVYAIDDYLGDFYLRNCFGADGERVSRICESIRMFYECMLQNGKIEQGDYDILQQEIRENYRLWMARAEGDIDLPPEESYGDYGSFDPFAFYK